MPQSINHNKIKVGFLIPTTSKFRNWKTIEETYFCQFFLRSLIGTTNSKFQYRIYLVIDEDDVLFYEEDFKIFKELNILYNIKIIKTKV